jgi:hypothetical protein
MRPGAGAMLVASRLAGLSALEAHYAGVKAGAQQKAQSLKLPRGNRHALPAPGIPPADGFRMSAGPRCRPGPRLGHGGKLREPRHRSGA